MKFFWLYSFFYLSSPKNRCAASTESKSTPFSGELLALELLIKGYHYNKRKGYHE